MKDFLKRLPLFLRIILIAAIILIGATFFFYLKTFAENGLSTDTGDWSAFGSYLSGTLGSIFAFAAFLGLLYTVLLQIEVIRSSDAEKKQLSELLKSQKDFIAQQLTEIKNHRFDDIFFKMLSIAENSLNEAAQGSNSGRENFKKMTERLVKKIVETLNTQIHLRERRYIYTEIRSIQYDMFFGPYFNCIFQIFTLIQDLEPELQKKYMDLLAATLSGSGVTGILIVSKTPNGAKYENLLKKVDYEANFDPTDQLLPVLKTIK